MTLETHKVQLSKKPNEPRKLNFPLQKKIFFDELRFVKWVWSELEINYLAREKIEPVLAVNNNNN